VSISKQPQRAENKVSTAKYYEGPAEVTSDVRLHQRFFAYETDAGMVGGADFNVMFAIDRPAREVWPYLKDFNRCKIRTDTTTPG